MRLEDAIDKEIDSNLSEELIGKIDTEFIALVEDADILEITNALDKTDNHLDLTAKINWKEKQIVLKDLALYHTDIFKELLTDSKNMYDIRKFMLKRSNKFNFYCYLDIENDLKEIIQALIVYDKYNKIKGIIMIRNNK